MSVHEIPTESALPTTKSRGRPGGSSLPPDDLPPEPTRQSPPRWNRAAALLILPTLVLLSIVILYPVVSAVVLSFRRDPTIDRNTGKFVDQGFAGLSNYSHWLFQRCTDSTGASIACPDGTLGSLFWQSMSVTVFFTIATVAIEIGLGLW